MGSEFSIENDTSDPVWIREGICKEALLGTVGAGFTVVTLGAGGAVLLASGVVVGATSIASTATVAATFLGVSSTTWAGIGSVSAILAAAAGIVNSSVIGKEREKLVAEAKRIQVELRQRYKRIKPGQKFTYKGTLSLVRTVYVVYDNFGAVSHNCFTGPTDGSVNNYKLSEHF